jgi:chromosome segregation ATPase
MIVFRVDHIANQLEENLQARSQLERTVFQLTAELQQMRGRIEAQASEVGTLSKELRNKSLKLEQDNRLVVGIQFGFVSLFV